MDTQPLSPDSLKKIMELCRSLRSDMGSMFVHDMSRFLDKLPAQLVEEAEKAPLNQQQDYFDIVTLLRRDADQAHQGVNAAMTICIEEFIHYVQNIDKISVSETQTNLSLIDTDDIEVSIMIEGLAGRIASKFSDTVNDAFLRVKQMVPTLQQATQLPCHPRALIQAMIDSLTMLSLSTSQKIILAKLYAPFIDAEKLEAIIKTSFADANIPAYDKSIKIANQNNKSSARNQTADNTLNQSAVMPSVGAPKAGHPMAQGTQSAHTQHAAAIGNSISNSMHSGIVNTTGHAGSHQHNSTAAYPAQGDSSQAGSSQHSESHQNAPAFTNANELLQQLGHLKALRQKMSNVPVVPEPKNPMVVEQTLQTTALDGILADIQQAQPTTSIKTDNTVQSVGEIRNQIRQHLKSDDENIQVIQDKDSDVINLVSMMFDYILDNPNLPTAMKALLARLQIPMLRVALLSPSFFAESHHPARQLLDQLSKSGISWDKATDKDSYYDKLESIVFRVLKEFRDEVSLFDTLLAELNAFLNEQNQRADRTISRTKATAEKKAQTEVSKSFVQKQLNERLIGKKLPFAVVKILQNGWWHVLYHTLIRHGHESAQWKNALKVVDALVWSVTPSLSNQKEWLEQVTKIQPKLITNLKKGLEQVNFDSLQTSQLIGEIENIHADVLQERELQKINVSVQTAKNTETDNTEHQPASNTVSAASETLSTESDPKDVERRLRSAHTTQDMPAITLPSEKIATLSDAQNIVPIDDAFIDMVKQLKNGAWVEFKADTDTPHRCKLVAKIRALDKLVFTNRRGIKVAEVGQTKLARQLESGKARIIEEDAHIVATAIHSVLTSVEKIEQEHSTA